MLCAPYGQGTHTANSDDTHGCRRSRSFPGVHSTTGRRPETSRARGHCTQPHSHTMSQNRSSGGRTNPKTLLKLSSPSLALEHKGGARRPPPQTTHAHRTETTSGATPSRTNHHSCTDTNRGKEGGKEKEFGGGGEGREEME